MKKIFLLILLASIMQAIGSQDICCDPSTKDYVNNYKKDGATWLKDFNVYSAKCCNEQTKESKFTIFLQKGVQYRFVAKNSPKFPGKMKIAITNVREEEIISELTTNNNERSYDFTPTKKGAYHINVSYPDGKEGCGTVAIFFVKTIN